MTLGARTQGLSVEINAYLERGEGIGGDVEGGDLYVLEEVVEVVRVQENLGEGLVAGALAKHRSAVERDLLLLVPKPFDFMIEYAHYGD